MSDKSTRILISCLIVGLISCFCVTALGAGGLAVYWLSPETMAIVNTPPAAQTSPTPTIDDSAPALPPPDPSLPESEPSIATPAPSLSIPDDIANQMDEIERQVVQLRGLEPLESVDRYLMRPEELREHVMNEFLDDYTEADARDDAIELAAFGLLREDFDLYNLYLDLYSEQIAGFYDDEVKAMYVIQGDGFKGPQRMTYAHEYVHALQDQHYNFSEGLNYNDEACKEDSERCAAIQALIEGDASFTETQWFFTFATDQDRRELREFYNNYSSPVFDRAPQFMRESLIFPYVAGQEFVEHLFDRGGWDAIEEAYRNPPVSTSQILHPESFPDKRPVLVELPELHTLLGDDWREVSRNVVGEYYTYLILAQGIDESARLREIDARDAAAGWAGDAYLIYYNDNTGETVLVLHTVWDSASEAQEFSSAFINYGDARFNNTASNQPNQRGWQNDDGYHQIITLNETTTWILAPNETISNQILNTITNP